MAERRNNVAAEVLKDEFVITRIFNAPRAVVFKVWTETEHLKYWWGPKGYAWVSGTMDLCPGGMFHYCMCSPDGHEMWGKFVYHDIIAPELLTFIVSFSDKDRNTLRNPHSAVWPMEILNTLTFSEHDNKTIVVMRGIPINATEEEHKTFKAGYAGMQQGFKGTMDQLDQYLSNIIKDKTK